MQVEIKVIAETEDEHIVNDAVTALEATLPYMFDNVLVTSWVGDADNRNSDQ